ncbi:MAG: histidine phosphatase family protein [Candidatus Diapherotrites archaeon]|nr:histidine phosphatase family protein [Candidatus Diapherotrites archaeon]
MKTIFAMRHGQTRFNRDNLFSGRLEVRLTKIGTLQAQQIGKWFSKNGVVFDAVYSSPLSRAVRTAKIVCEKTGFDPKRIRVAKPLIEQDFGSWESLNSRAIEAVEGPVVSKWFSDRWSVTPRGGENYSDLERRLKPFAQKLARSSRQTILVVAHANIVRVLVKLLAKLNRKRTNRLTVHNNVFYRIRFKGKKRVLAHLSV